MSTEDPDPADIFAPLSNPTRVEILQALGSAYSESPTEPRVEYSDLKDQVGIRDNGNFNYHLRELWGFVKKRHGYMLTRSGIELLSAAKSGILDAEWTWGQSTHRGSVSSVRTPSNSTTVMGYSGLPAVVLSTHLGCRHLQHYSSHTPPRDYRAGCIPRQSVGSKDTAWHLLRVSGASGWTDRVRRRAGRPLPLFWAV